VPFLIFDPKGKTHNTPATLYEKKEWSIMRRSVRYCNIPLEQDKQKEPLKLRPCPNPQCRRVGCLIGHGHLCGWGEGNQRVIRGERVLCSQRRRGPKGCGKTFSILKTA